MTACMRVVMLLAVSSSIVRCDLTLKLRTVAGAGQSSETTEYYKDNMMRRDFGPGYQVVDFSTGRSVSVDVEKKEYYPFDGASRTWKQVVDRSRKIFVEVTCSATGEQRQWFGYTARRYLTTKKSHDEVNGKASAVREAHLDAWILDFPAPPHVEGIASPNANAILSFGAGDVMTVPDVTTTHSGARPHGLVMWLKTDQYESEVVALSDSPLDESLFAIPKGFREVTSNNFDARPRSWSDQIELELARFGSWFFSLFER